MRNKTIIHYFIMLTVLLFAFASCKKDKSTTPAEMPELSTLAIDEITDTTAIGGGKIISDGGAEILEQGICWSTASPPTITDNKVIDNNGLDGYTGSMVDLVPNTTYYVRAYATNSAGTGYGSIISFSSLEKGTVKDIDGNIYHTIKIGTQTWMVENLKVTRYNDGTDIPLATEIWGNLTTPAYCWYDNNEAENKDTYGAIYNWYTTQNEKLSPKGWHVSTNDDWQSLIDHITGVTAGGMLKEPGYSHWLSPNSEATNYTGFNALPGGSRLSYFAQKGYIGGWWSASATPNRYMLTYDAGDLLVSTNITKWAGYSIRCVKD